MTPTPHDITSAEVVAELRDVAAVRRQASADERDKALFVIAKLSRQDGELMERAAALIESLRATIERVERESALIGSACDKLRTAHSQEMSQGLALRDELRLRAEAAEARVTALVRDLTSVKQQCETAVYNISQREHDAAVVRSFQNIADFCAQALSRSSTEVKNDG